MTNNFSIDKYQRPTKLKSPNNEKKVLLHSCCAPCAGEVMETIAAAGIEQHVFFYNPNIHPRTEYDVRKNENKRFCDKLNIAFTDEDYNTDDWFKRVKGLEWEPERSKRCTQCFDMRFERTALFAHENSYSLISSTLGISRWKNMEQINEAGVRAALPYKNMNYWTFNWRKQGGSARMLEISKREHFYQQEYCSCVYSLRDTNAHRIKFNREPVRRGVKFYGKEAL